jgi:hypothetical protein
MSENLFYFAIVLGISPLILLKVLKIKDFQIFYIEPYLWLLFVSSIYELISYRLNIPSAYWFRFYILIDFLLLFYFYFLTLNKKYKLLFYSFLATFLFFYMYLLTVWDVKDTLRTDFYLTVFETVFVLISSLLWFTTLFSELKETSLLRSPNYYFVAGFVFYYTGTFFLFLVSDFMIKNMASEMMTYWNINILFNILLRTLILLGIWMARKK